MTKACFSPGGRASATAHEAERRLAEAGIALTLGGEPTLVPDDPVGAEWTVAADGPTKLRYAYALAREIRRRSWPDSTLMLCPGKRYEGEVNPRWVLRLLRHSTGAPIAPWPGTDEAVATPLQQAAVLPWLQALGRQLGVPLHPVELADPLDPLRRIWAACLWETDDGELAAAPWPLRAEQRRLSTASGPAGLRLPLEFIPADRPRQVLTLEVDADGWDLFLPPLARRPLERLLTAIAACGSCPIHGHPLLEPKLSGVVPLDADGHWQVVGLTADPGVLEVNLPVCSSWSDYHQWLELLETAGAAVGLRSWKVGSGGRPEGTGGGNHLLWGGPSLECNAFFRRPAWLVGILRYWQHHPCLAYLFTGNCVGPASQAPRPDEALGGLFDLELAYRQLEDLEQRHPDRDHRVLIGETLRHLHADRSGNNHRSEISVDKFWNPGVPAGCLGLIEFRALESMPNTAWMSAVALLWSALAALLLDPRRRPARLRPWGSALQDQALLPTVLQADLQAVLSELDQAGLGLAPEPFLAIWEWRFPLLLRWQQGEAWLEVREALEPWPLICDVPREGGFTSRFVDASLRRFELITNAEFRKHYDLHLNGRLLPLNHQPLAVRYRHHRLYPCLHPGIAPHLPLGLEVHPRRADDLPVAPVAQWQLLDPANGFQPTGDRQPAPRLHPWHLAPGSSCTVDLRL